MQQNLAQGDDASWWCWCRTCGGRVIGIEAPAPECSEKPDQRLINRSVPLSVPMHVWKNEVRPCRSIADDPGSRGGVGVKRWEPILAHIVTVSTPSSPKSILSKYLNNFQFCEIALLICRGTSVFVFRERWRKTQSSIVHSWHLSLTMRPIQ